MSPFATGLPMTEEDSPPERGEVRQLRFRLAGLIEAQGVPGQAADVLADRAQQIGMLEATIASKEGRLEKKESKKRRLQMHY
jgi:hypothetical protein